MISLNYIHVLDKSICIKNSINRQEIKELYDSLIEKWTSYHKNNTDNTIKNLLEALVYSPGGPVFQEVKKSSEENVKYM